MKPIIYGLLVSAMLPILASCNEDNPWQGNDSEGGITIKVNTDCTVRDAIPTRSEALAPNASEFGIKLTKTDNTYSGSWENMDAFPADQGFRAGEYLFEAFYGTPTDEGYEKPYYHGESTINVRPGEVCEAEVTAALVNTMVSISYTDAFKNYFTEYKSTLHSSGYGYHEVDDSRDDAIYLVPGEVSITVDFTKQNGKSATIQPASFRAEGRHHYHVTLDVYNGQIGDAQLKVIFDDTIVEEDVTIDLSDELLDVSAPEVTPAGFTEGEALQTLETNGASFIPKMNVFAAGIITAATLTVESDTFTPAFGREIDLANCSATQQQQLAALGIKAIGFFKNPDKMAALDFSGIFANLPAGTHKFTLVVKDKLTRVNEPVTLEIVTNPLEISLVSAAESKMGTTTGNITVAYNGSELDKHLTVKAKNDYGVYVDAPITNVIAAASKARSTRSAAFPTKNYNVTLSIPNTTRDTDIELYYNGNKVATGKIARILPNYSVSANAWANKVILKVNPETASDMPTIVNNFRAFNGSTELSSSNISGNASTGEVTITGLTPATAYSLKTTCSKNNNPEFGATASFTTEAALQPENGDMEEWYSQQVGKKMVGFGRTDIDRWFPWAQGGSSYWNTRNMLTSDQKPNTATYNYTCYSGTSRVNGVSGYAAEIKTLGFGDGNTNAGGASVVNHRAAGMLFMGDYTYTYNAGKYNDDGYFNFGRPFTSRPTSLQFDYKFSSYNSESFIAYVVIENRNGGTVTELGRGTFESNANQGSFTTKTVNITYTNTTLKATHAYVVFKSSTADSPKTEASGGIHRGNVLTVDNIRFNY